MKKSKVLLVISLCAAAIVKGYTQITELEWAHGIGGAGATMVREIKRLTIVLILVTFYCTSYCQPLDFQNSTYYLGPGTSLTSSGQNLSAFNFNTALSTHEIFNDGLYYPIVDYLGNNLWVRIRHIAADPNGTTVGHNVTSTQNSPFSAGGFGGWWGFLYQIDIFRDINLTGARGNVLNGIFRATVKVESIETLGLGEWVAFEITDNVNAEWVLNSKSGTPAYSSTKLPYTDPSFSTTFPIGNNNLYVIHDQNGCCAQFSISANSVSQFKFGYEYSSGGGYQGLTLTFGTPPLLPTITSFAPAFGPIGTTVTITGTNFDLTPSNNIVFFGATQATVTGSTSTQLTVNVPTGATYEPISVSVNGLTAHAPRPFVVTFSGGGSIDTCAFAPATTIATTTNFDRSAFADVDGDGKPDLLIPNFSGNFLSIFKNISTQGSITPSSFAPKIDFPTGTQPLGVAVGDLDGDGKRDVAVVNYTGGKLSVYKNLSTSGTISLAAKVDYTIPTFAHDISIADMDGDGKQDLVITTSFSGLTVLRNIGTSGIINATTFAAGVNFSTGSNAFPFALGDLDGDGKLDAAVPNANSYTFALLRNTSIPGTLSFATQTIVVTPGAPSAGMGVATTVMGDIDGDTKLDLVVTTNTVNTVSLFRNTSTPGSLSFDPKFDIKVLATSYLPALSDLDGDGKIELIVDRTPTSISIYKNVSSAGVINAASFATPVIIPKVTSNILLAGDVDGDGRSEIISSAFSLQVFRNVIGTISPPTITSFTPTIGPVGSTVTITGTNFNTPFSNTVEFNGIPATITGSTANTLTVTVPDGATTGPIEITIGCNATASSNFTVGIPTITFTTQPVDTTFCKGSSTVFSVVATGQTNLTYQWQKLDGSVFNNIGDNDNYSGTKSSTLNINTEKDLVIGDYRCEVSGDNAVSIISDTVSLTLNVNTALAVITPNGNTLTASSGNSYQWFYYGEPISGATSRALEINIFEYGVYAVEVTSNGCSTRSEDFVYLITEIEKKDEGLKLYPNPVEKILLVEYNPPYTIDIINSIGNQITKLKSETRTTSIDCSMLPKGIYILQLKNEKGILYNRVIKNK